MKLFIMAIGINSQKRLSFRVGGASLHVSDCNEFF